MATNGRLSAAQRRALEALNHDDNTIAWRSFDRGEGMMVANGMGFVEYVKSNTWEALYLRGYVQSHGYAPDLHRNKWTITDAGRAALAEATGEKGDGR